MSRQLEQNELVCFGFAHFDCEARRGSGMSDEVEVIITMFKGMRYRFLCNSTLTLDEIKELTAYRVLDQLKEYSREVENFTLEIRKKTCPNAYY